MKHTKTDIQIFGVHPVREVIQTNPDIVTHVFIDHSLNSETQQEMKHLLKKNSIPFSDVSHTYIDGILGKDRAHQGILATLREFPYVDFDEWLGDIREKEGNHAIILLDEVQDPHNVGAIIRSAAAFGFAGVLLPKHNQAMITGTVFKSSAGAILHIPIMRIGNVAHTLEVLQEARFWVAGLQNDPNGIPITQHVFDSPTVFIIGNEHVGLRKRTQDMCDHIISIPLNSDVESLNASASAAVACFEFRRQNPL